MLELVLTVSSWRRGYSILPDYSDGDRKPVPLSSSRWIGGDASAELSEREHFGSQQAIQVIEAARKISWAIHPDRISDSQGRLSSVEAEKDRTSGIVGRSEFTADGGYIEVFSVGSRNFKWIIQALEACNASSFDFIFTVERTERGILNLTGMSLGNGGRL